MAELDLGTIKARSLRGIVALVTRTFVLQVVAFGATFLLTVFLAPQVFGIFYVVSAVIAFLTYFSDVGLAAALIQKKEMPNDEDLATTFTIQQILVGSVSIIAVAASPWVVRLYGLDHNGAMLLYALIGSFFLSSLKTIPSILLERRLEFGRLVIPQIAETVGFYVIAVVLAWMGWGVAAFTWAVVVRALVGVILMYIVSPWRIRLGISRPVASKLLKFGVPFQLNSILALLKDDLMTMFLGKTLGFAGIGYIGWAKKWAEAPLRLIMDSMIRVTFPAFSRLQGSKELLGKAIDRALFGLAAAILPISVVMFFFMHQVVGLIPKYGKWEPAILSFYLFTLSSAVAAFSTPLTNALNAIGKIKTTLVLMIFWTVGTWVSNLVLIRFFGFNGVAMTAVLLSLSVIAVVRLISPYASFSIVRSIRWPVTAAVLQAVLYAVVVPRLDPSPALLAAEAVAGLAVFTVVLWATERNRIIEIAGTFRKAA
jgi:O-antigen/teichoic acid export membrane protein